MKTIILYIFFLFFILFGTLQSQQSPVFTLYNFSPYLVNPAIAGSEGYTEFSFVGRQDMIGMANSPYTNMILYQSRLMKTNYAIIRDGLFTRYKRGRSGRVGLGGYLYNDRNGAIDRIGFQLTYAYHVFVNNTQISGGFNFNGHQFKVVADEVEFKELDDPLLSDLGEAIYIPDADIGLYVRGLDYYAGISVSQMMQSFLKFGNATEEEFDSYRMFRQYYLLGGYFYETRNINYKLEPSFLVKASEQMFIQADLNFKVHYQEQHWAGITFRTNKTISAMFGSKWRKMHFGYAFDYTFNSLRPFNYGSHEVVLTFKFGDNVRRYKWIRRY